MRLLSMPGPRGVPAALPIQRAGPPALGEGAAAPKLGSCFGSLPRRSLHHRASASRTHGLLALGLQIADVRSARKDAWLESLATQRRNGGFDLWI